MQTIRTPPTVRPLPFCRATFRRAAFRLLLLLTNEDWGEFRRRFERMHPGFFWQLKSQFTDLILAEERLLALSKLRLDTRQMSRMLGIAPNSIRTTKYRLRKKIGVNGTSPLLELLVEPKE
jgi:DNA-binding CsgD family transcriptional regulator